MVRVAAPAKIPRAPMARVYTKEEADTILARALDIQRGDGTSHEDLVAAAREVGISPEVLERAAAEVVTRRQDELELVAIRERAWRGFYAHLVPYVMVAALLGFVNYMTTSFPWAAIVVPTVSIMEFRDGKVAHETQYFADPFEAPAWRAR